MSKDNLNQVGGNLSSNRKKSDRSINRTKKIIPQIERVRDVLDFSIPMEFQFVQKFEGHRVMFTLTFYPPPKNGCCADCYCAVCEFYDGGTTETQLQTTYSYIPGSITAFKNNVVTTNYTETNPQAGEVTLWAHTNEDVVLCYQYDACIGGALDTTQQKFGFSYPTTPPPPSPYPPPADGGGSTTSPPPPVVSPPPPDTTYVPPPPSSGSRRFALPTVTNTFSPGGGVASNGTTDCSSSMQSFIDSVPDGSTIYFPAGAKYRMANNGILLDNRHNLIFTTDPSNPATILTEGSGINDSTFKLEASNTHITIQYIIGKGNNPDVRTSNQYHVGSESNEFLAMYGDNSYIELDSVRAYDNWGHFVYIARGGHSVSPSNVWVHNSTAVGMGVMGVAIASVVNMWVEDNSIVDTAIYPVDFEDGQANEPMHNVVVARNALTRWGWNSYYTGHVIVGDGGTGMSWNSVTIDSNTFTGGFQTSPQNGQYGQISFIGSDTKYGLVIINNHGLAGAGPTVTIANAPNAIVSGNTP